MDELLKRSPAIPAERAIGTLPSEEKLRCWTMRNSAPTFQDSSADAWYDAHEAEFNADADEFYARLNAKL